MANFFSKLFGKGKGDTKAEELLTTALDGIIQNGGFQLEYKVETQGESVVVNLSGTDSNLLTDKDGLVLDGFQTYLKRLLQNKLPETTIDVVVDCEGYLESSAQDLKDLADKLKQIAIDRGQASFVRALSPRDRKTIHRHLADDTRVKSQSIGEGFYKKIKITPVGMKPQSGRGQGRGQNRSQNRGDRNNGGNRRRNNHHRPNRDPNPTPNWNDDNRGNVLQHDESLEGR